MRKPIEKLPSDQSQSRKRYKSPNQGPTNRKNVHTCLECVFVSSQSSWSLCTEVHAKAYKIKQKLRKLRCCLWCMMVDRRVNGIWMLVMLYESSFSLHLSFHCFFFTVPYLTLTQSQRKTNYGSNDVITPI